MGHPRVYRAAVAGKHRGNKPNPTTEFFALTRRLTFAAVAFFLVAASGSAGYAQSGPFAGMAGNWSGGGTITLDDGSTERIRCRASYAVGAGGNGLNQSLTCASDSYKFNLASNVIAQAGTLSGTWSESIRNVSGNLDGRGGGGNFQVMASGPGFTASIALTTRGNKQSVVIRSQGTFRVTSISLSRR
ncbi:hypothetical protein KMZ68_14260 [Bradyrhizobium sediminis]|uniref:Uncharacterized protein n=1 Tax=Bradyrhizobium sediminis TaxID=2840469 RepID=A0A975NLG3_9BRAD|nr:hypothetical protein [Bradyrhizobium sediminis]QWG16204.1 hypothetical protein KMZ68_14260 [Bradyrhizobium sediminis]